MENTVLSETVYIGGNFSSKIWNCGIKVGKVHFLTKIYYTVIATRTRIKTVLNQEIRLEKKLC